MIFRANLKLPRVWAALYPVALWGTGALKFLGESLMEASAGWTALLAEGSMEALRTFLHGAGLSAFVIGLICLGLVVIVKSCRQNDCCDDDSDETSE